MVHAINQASGDLGTTWRGALKLVLEDGDPHDHVNEKTGKVTKLTGPAAVYGVYQSFCLAVESEASRR